MPIDKAKDRPAPYFTEDGFNVHCVDGWSPMYADTPTNLSNVRPSPDGKGFYFCDNSESDDGVWKWANPSDNPDLPRP